MKKVIHQSIKEIFETFFNKETYTDIIFRDDDINFLTDLDQFKRVDSLFKLYKVDHTIAVIAKDIDKNQDLVKYIKENPHIKVQLHAWQHVDFTKMDESKLTEHFTMGINKLTEVFGIKPTTWYPPWNRTNSFVNSVAIKCNLIPSWKQTSLMYYVQRNSVVYDIKNKVQNAHRLDFGVINFHYWADSDMMFLDPALENYANSRSHR